MSTRRELLRTAAATGLAALLPTAVVELLASPVASTPASEAEGHGRSAFLPHVGDAFRVDGRTTRLHLVDVTDLPCADSQGLRGHEHCFSLRFNGPVPLAQDTYTLTHARLGRFPMFLVPMGTAGAAAVHEAVINRHVPA